MSFRSAPALLRSLGGMARTAELSRHGVTTGELRRAVASGEVIRPRQGVYALPGTDAALLHAASHGGVPACTDAAALHGLWILARSETPHVWMGTAGTPRGACAHCRLHWDDGTAVVGRLPPVENVLLQIAQCEGDEAFFVALESALRQLRLSPGGIAWLWKHLPVKMRWLLAFARADADSGLESLVRLRLHRHGIRVRTQVHIRGVGEVDLVVGDRLIIECDGRENHEREHRRHRDLMRDATAAAQGYETLRFDYAMIVHDWSHVEAAILAKIADGAHLRSTARSHENPDRPFADRRVVGRPADLMRVRPGSRDVSAASAGRRSGLP